MKSRRWSRIAFSWHRRRIGGPTSPGSRPPLPLMSGSGFCRRRRRAGRAAAAAVNVGRVPSGADWLLPNTVVLRKPPGGYGVLPSTLPPPALDAQVVAVAVEALAAAGAADES